MIRIKFLPKLSQQAILFIVSFMSRDSFGANLLTAELGVSAVESEGYYKKDFGTSKL
jgi:hypothetical protein